MLVWEFVLEILRNHGTDRKLAYSLKMTSKTD